AIFASASELLSRSSPDSDTSPHRTSLQLPLRDRTSPMRTRRIHEAVQIPFADARHRHLRGGRNHACRGTTLKQAAQDPILTRNRCGPALAHGWHYSLACDAHSALADLSYSACSLKGFDNGPKG